MVDLGSGGGGWIGRRKPLSKKSSMEGNPSGIRNRDDRLGRLIPRAGERSLATLSSWGDPKHDRDEKGSTFVETSPTLGKLASARSMRCALPETRAAGCHDRVATKA